mmetsp:Transcript_50843/g.93997  ORF Transcript_50843/g.93997 Transcript_50843/m.93997 type:complete len:1104 (-) Transcript_50843:28-3339(-)
MSDFPLGDAVPPPKEVKRAKSSSGRHKEEKHRDGREHREGRGDHHHKEGRERRDVLEGEGHREDKHRQGGDIKSRRDMESWLDVDLTQEGGDRNSEGLNTPSARERIPKRPSSRADSRPKGPNSAQGLGGDQPRPPPEARPAPPATGSSHKSRSSSKHGSSRHAEKVAATGTTEARPPAQPQGEAVRPPAPPADGAGVVAPTAPKESKRPKPRHAEPAPPEVHDEDIVPEAAQRRHPKAATSTRNGHAPPQNVPQVDDEHIEIHAHRPHKHPEPALDEEEIPEEYDDDFVDDDDGEDYKPQPIKPVVPSLATQLPPETKPKPSVDGRVVVRPQSRGMDGPALSARSPSPGLSADPAAVARINEVLSRDKAKVQNLQTATAAASKTSEGKGCLANYESTMPKFNLANTTLTEKVAYRRLQDLRQMNILSKRSVEKAVIFTQQPQSAHSLFLAGKSLKYANAKTVHCQTGDDDQEIGVQTEDTMTEDKEDQFPVLTMGKTSVKTGGEPTQLLPFLRRTLPLFEAAMNEARSRAAKAYKADRRAVLDASEPATCTAKCCLPKSFQENFIGQGLTIADVTLCPNWYGADHIVVLNTWPWRDKPVPPAGEALATFMRPVQSIIGLYALEGTMLQEGLSLRPARCLYSFCRLTSMAVVPGRAHLIIAGSETGSLLVWDLRQKAQAPGASGGVHNAAIAADEDLAHFQGAVWLRPAFSTDTFALSSTQRVERDDFLDSSMNHIDGGMQGSDEGMHLAEICCVRCSEGVEGDSLIFSLDSSGLVNFWRVLEIASSGNTTVKLAPQGSCSVASPTRNLCHFADSTYLCIHPQQQAQFVVVSASGLIQTNRHNSSSIADGPSRLELSSGRACADEVMDADGLPMVSLGGFEAQPCSAAFNPFFPGLLLAAYADGELALFDSVLCVPLVHWSGAVSQVPTDLVSVAWSPMRPSVFFVKSGSLVDVWDLSEKMFAPALTVDLREHIRQIGGWQRTWCEAPDGSTSARASTCCELHAAGRGDLVVSDGGVAVVLRLPEQLTVPRQTVPPQHAKVGAGGLKDLRQIDDLVQPGADRTAVFPTLSRHVRHVSIPPQCHLEVEILRRVLASASPLQAWT